MIFSNGRTSLMGRTLAIGLTLFPGLVFAAEQRSANDIINALKSPRVTRGLTTFARRRSARRGRDTVYRCIAQSTHPFALD
jgi:hypothetical protein